MPIINQNTINLLLTKVTARGRELMSEGKFNFEYYSLGDTDWNYLYDGEQKTLTPLAYQQNVLDNLNKSCELEPLPKPNKKVIKLVNKTSITNDFENYFVASGVTTNSGTNQIDLGLFNLVDGDTLYLSFSDGTILTFTITTNIASSIVTLDRPLPLILEDVSFEVYRFDSNFLNVSANTVYFDSIEQKFKTNCNVIKPCEINFTIVNQCDIMGVCDEERTIETMDVCGSGTTIISGSTIEDLTCKDYVGLVKLLGYHTSCNDIADRDCNESLESILENPCWIGLIHFNKEMGEQICIDNGREFQINLKGKTYTANPNRSITNSQVYHNLEDSVGNIIGRVYNHLQIIAIHDQELLSCLNPISNRSFQFPQMSGRLVTDKVNGILKPNQCMWLTYTMNANGYREFLPNQNILFFKNETVVNKNIEFYFDDLTMVDNIDFNSLKIIYQISNNCEQPTPCDWKVVDFSDSLVTNGLLDLTLATQKTDYLLDNFKNIKATDYRLSYLSNTSQVCNTKIDASFDFYIGRELYKSVFNIKVDGSSLKSSKNCTWSRGQNVILSEIGIYNSDRELIIISKLTNPIKLDSTTLYNLEVSVDF